MFCTRRYILTAFGRQWTPAHEEAIGLPARGAGPPGRRLRISLVQLQRHARSVHFQPGG